MKKIITRFLLIVLALILLISIGFIVFVQTFDISDYKNDLIATFNKNTGLLIDIKGDIGVEVDEYLHLSLSEVTLRDSLGVLAEFEKLDLTIATALPNGKIVINSVAVQSPVYHFRTKGIIPIKTGQRTSYKSWIIGPSISIDSVMVDSVSVSNGRFVLYDSKDRIFLDARNINVDNADFAMLGFDDILHSFDINALAYFDRLSAFGFEVKKGNCQFRMVDGVLIFDAEYLRNHKDEFDMTLDLNPEDVRYHIKAKSHEENIRELFSKKGDKVNWVRGMYTGECDIKFILGDSTINLSSLSGTIKLESSESKLYGISLDNMVKTFKKTQQFSFKDIGSVMLFGPIGLALSKGGDYAQLALASKKDSTLIDYLHCQISIDTGLVDFHDVAFRTAKNRVALMGRIDFLHNSYHNFSYALIDKEGCSVIREEYNGPFEQATSKGINNFAILMGPVTNLFQSTSSVVLRNDCEKTYTGVVQLPEKQKGFFKRLGLKKQ